MENISVLAKSARNGDARAFGEIYSAFSGEMYRYAYYCLGNEAAAQDAVQETALEAWKSISKLKNENAAKAWLFRILGRQCKHALREKYKADFAAFEETENLAAEDSSERAQAQIDLLRLLERLSEEERQIILLGTVGGLNSREIAKIIEIPAATVRSKLSRALKKLREEGGKTK